MIIVFNSIGRGGRGELTFEAVGRPQPLDFRINSKLALRLGLECNDNLANQPERASEGEMPWGLLICDHVAQMVVENIDDLIIRDRIFVSTTYTKLVMARVQGHR